MFTFIKNDFTWSAKCWRNMARGGGTYGRVSHKWGWVGTAGIIVNLVWVDRPGTAAPRRVEMMLRLRGGGRHNRGGWQGQTGGESRGGAAAHFHGPAATQTARVHKVHAHIAEAEEGAGASPPVLIVGGGRGGGEGTAGFMRWRREMVGGWADGGAGERGGRRREQPVGDGVRSRRRMVFQVSTKI